MLTRFISFNTESSKTAKLSCITHPFYLFFNTNKINIEENKLIELPVATFYHGASFTSLYIYIHVRLLKKENKLLLIANPFHLFENITMVYRKI